MRAFAISEHALIYRSFSGGSFASCCRFLRCFSEVIVSVSVVAMLGETLEQDDGYFRAGPKSFRYR
jgi:hypothetical protein